MDEFCFLTISKRTKDRLISVLTRALGTAHRGEKWGLGREWRLPPWSGQIWIWIFVRFLLIPSETMTAFEVTFLSTWRSNFEKPVLARIQQKWRLVHAVDGSNNWYDSSAKKCTSRVVKSFYTL